jgi:hypothetical protein
MIRVVIGVLLILVGGVWFFQGIDLLGGSFMSGQAIWAVIGVIAVIAGAALILSGVRGPRPTPDDE